MSKYHKIRIGTRDSELAVWQATHVKELLNEKGYASELVFIKSEGDIDLKTPLYEMGVQGIFTRNLDMALLDNRIDFAVHSMKDVPTLLPEGLSQAAVLKRANYQDLFIPHPSLMDKNSSGDEFALDSVNNKQPSVLSLAHIATSSIRRKAQWLNRFPHHTMENLRGNINTRLIKLKNSGWSGAIFAAAGVERINLRPEKAVEISWMLPAPAQGAIMIVVRTSDREILETSNSLNHERTAVCTKIERDFLRAVLGGCSTPISALAEYNGDEIYFRGNILSTNGKQKVEIAKITAVNNVEGLGARLAMELLENGGKEIADSLQ